MLGTNITQCNDVGKGSSEQVETSVWNSDVVIISPSSSIGDDDDPFTSFSSSL